MNSLIQASDYFYFIQLDEKGIVLDANEFLQNQCQFLNHPLIKSSFSELVYYKDFSNYEFLLKKSLEKGERKFIIDLRKVKSDGSDFYWTRWEFTITSKVNHYSISGIGHKVSPKKEKEVEFPETVNNLHARHDLMEGLLDDNLIGFWNWDIADQSDQLSLSLNEMFGYNPLLNGRGRKNVKWKKHIHPGDKPKVELELKEHFNTFGKHPFHCEFRIKNRHKKDIWVLGYGKVIKWENNGKPEIMVGCFFDISERKKSENLIHKQSQYLKTVTFNQSHLMRSKLANIIGILEIIDPKSPQIETAHFLKMIKTEAKKLDEELRKSISDSNSFDLSPLVDRESAGLI
ncbi:PAS domain-containing protein [Aquiflexum balticum DSM 16537]|uniref:histidine kinase n=1 Tax=Aquiflexum balticum DSM 16537 TaxID=758820 RepID=A0A1W2H4A2_9BACT|nr:PAS domain-containing protein [Aquiflexum balticum]SMD43753.1 PAS domain-containing protein [Aquiflexum balticum DSM 16537]